MALDGGITLVNMHALEAQDKEQISKNIEEENIEHTEKAAKEEDPFDAINEYIPEGVAWKDLNNQEKVKRVSITLSKFIILLGLLYLFICSLSFLGSAFQLLGGKTAGEAFSSDSLISNPVAGLMLGVLATVLLQSSSTTTSIIVAMVSSRILGVRPAIPIAMGANIGTSVTNTLVAIGQIGDKDEFRRAFAGGTVHDMFNLLSVLILLPLETISGYLYRLTKAIVDAAVDSNTESHKEYKKDLLKVITKPFTNLILQLDKKVIEEIATGHPDALGKSLVKYWCDKGVKEATTTLKNMTVTKNITSLLNVTTSVNATEVKNVTEWRMVHKKPCEFLLHNTGLSDTIVGVIMLLLALVILCTCLIFMVKILHSLLRGQIAGVIKKTFGSNFPKPFGFLTGYVAILVGAGMTMLVQSSSIFTSALTPLVGLGIVPLKKVYPLTLGSNIGTTGTSILAALASSGDLKLSLQIALCHLFFNISGIIIWYPIPFMRRIPINLAKKLGNITAQYRWFAVAYLIVVFFILPTTIFGLSLAGLTVFLCIMIPVALLLVFIVIVNIAQAKKVKLLPKPFQTWDWVPLACRSLEPYDKLLSRVGKVMKRKSTMMKLEES